VRPVALVCALIFPAAAFAAVTYSFDWYCSGCSKLGMGSNGREGPTGRGRRARARAPRWARASPRAAAREDAASMRSLAFPPVSRTCHLRRRRFRRPRGSRRSLPRFSRLTTHAPTAFAGPTRSSRCKTEAKPFPVDGETASAGTTCAWPRTRSRSRSWRLAGLQIACGANTRTSGVSGQAGRQAARRRGTDPQCDRIGAEREALWDTAGEFAVEGRISDDRRAIVWGTRSCPSWKAAPPCRFHSEPGAAASAARR